MTGEIRIETRTFSHPSIIEQAVIVDPMGEVMRQVCRVSDEQTQAALRDLGWIPPGEAKVLREDLRSARADATQTRLSYQRMPHEVADHVNALRDIARDYGATEQLRERIAYEVERFAKLGEAR